MQKVDLLVDFLWEYIHVHDYQNVLNFPYYFNIFQPECVIFEVAEYTISNGYFNLAKMKTLDYNPSFNEIENIEEVDIKNEKIIINEGITLTTISWDTEEDYSYVWLCLDSEFDMLKFDCGYQATIETKRYQELGNIMKIYIMRKDRKI